MNSENQKAIGRMSRGQRSGFTLIEVLVVIAMIALLMAILLPTLQRVRRQAKAVVCQSNLRQWGTTLALYSEDNQGQLPNVHWDGSGVWLLRGALLSGDEQNVPDDSFHHFSTKDIVCCPRAVKTQNNRYAQFTLTAEFGSVSPIVKGTPGSTFEAWEITTPGPPFRCSYGLNGWPFQPPDVPVSPFRTRPASDRPVSYTNIYSLRRTAGMPLLLDSTEPEGLGSYQSPPPEAEGGPRGSMATFCLNRHNGHVNCLFLDWSVRKVGLKELWTLKWDPEFNTANPWTKAGGVKPEDWPHWMRRFKDY